MSRSETLQEHQAGAKVAVERPVASLSRSLWGVAFHRVLPHRFEDGFTIHASDYERASPFVTEHYATIFEDRPDSPFVSKVNASRARYYALADFFTIERDGSTVGLVVCAPSDWSTYYVRSAALLPRYQGSGVIQRFFSKVLFDVLERAGVERVEVDVSPANLPMVHIVTRLSFNASGTLLTERWGAQTRFTKLLCPRGRQVFLDQFCAGVKYQLRGTRAAIPRGGEKGEGS
jgi:hypothetical protein